MSVPPHWTAVSNVGFRVSAGHTACGAVVAAAFERGCGFDRCCCGCVWSSQRVTTHCDGADAGVVAGQCRSSLAVLIACPQT